MTGYEKYKKNHAVGSDKSLSIRNDISSVVNWTADAFIGCLGKFPKFTKFPKRTSYDAGNAWEAEYQPTHSNLPLQANPQL